MARSRYISLLLAVLLVFTSVAIPLSARADINVSGLNRIQQYYLRLLGSLARADYYETDILASVTTAQAIYEGGWGRYSLPVGGNNLFGIKAYNTWDGMVYDQTNSLLYNSYADFMLSLGQLRANEVSAWRAHKNWAESVRVHSDLFLNSDKYTAVVGEKDYKVAIQAIVDGGYCNDDGYVQQAIAILERYGLETYDDITPDEDGVVAIVATDERVRLEIGETHNIALNCYPAEAVPSVVTWESDDPSVATVDAMGNITAVAHGTAFITATLENGREACCIVYVDCNATIIDEDVYVRKSPSKTAEADGKIYRGYGVKVLSEEIIVDSQSYEYIKVMGYNSSGKLVTGYVLAEFVYLNKRNVSGITVVKDDITLTPNQKYNIVASVTPADAVDAALEWTSSDETVAIVDEKGLVTALKKGNAVITAKAKNSGVAKEITLTVADAAKEYKGIVSVADSLRVRATAAWDAGTLGSLGPLAEVTVHGEPQGFWYYITGTTTRDKQVTGYIFSTYLRMIPEGESVEFSSSSGGVTVYKKMDTSSDKLGALSANTEIAIIGEAVDGWSYVVGTSASGDAIFGYAKLDGSGEIIEGGALEGGATEGENGEGGTTTVTGWYGIVTANPDLNVRASAVDGAVVGKYSYNSKVIVLSEEDGWCYTIGEDSNGNKIQGYASAKYISYLYNAEVINIDDNLNVRSEPSKSGEIIGKLQNGNKLTVIGEVDNNWYKIQTAELSGYCSADYVKINGKVTTEVTVNKPATDKDFSIVNTDITIEDGILYGVYANTKVSDFLKSFTGSVSVLNAEGKKLSDSDFVPTGAKLAVTNGNNVTEKAEIAVKGDVNGDGEITSMDYVLIKRSFFETFNLDGAYLKAAIVSGEAELNVIDYVIVKRVYFGTYSLE